MVRSCNGLAARLALLGTLCGAGRWSLAQTTTAPSPPPSTAPEPAPELAPEPEPTFPLPLVAIHGFVSQGAFLSTDNDYLGRSERGSFEFFEAAINVSTEVADRLRVGAQLFTRDLGPVGNYEMSLDWAYLDYRWREWLGLRAGRIKMPMGLYNEYSDIDAARVPILLPQSVYPIVSRDFLLAQTGFSLYGSRSLDAAGGADYQIFGGTIFITQSSYVDTPELRDIDTKVVAGAQLFWRTPVVGLRLGASYLHADIAFHLQYDAYTTAQLIMSGAVEPGFDGKFELGLRDIHLAIGSLEYSVGDWVLAAEYSRWWFEIYTTLPLLPGSQEDSERMYGMVTRRLLPWLEAGAYYSLYFVDPDDRGGHGDRFAAPDRAFQKDLAVSARFDVNDWWLWKLEAHYMDGAADLSPVTNPDPTRRWGFFLVKTTVSF